MTINIEITTTPDFSALAAVHAASFSSAWSAEDIASMLTVHGTSAFVAEGGFGLLRLIGDEAELLTLAVLPEQRRHGVGGAILGGMCSWLKGQSAQCLFLEVRASNAAALSLYERWGFSTIATRKDYYSNPNNTFESAVVMRLVIE